MTKITLATLHLATAQEVADQIVNHLLDQGVQSAQRGEDASCMYRHGELQCAAGCLIGDEEYRTKFEFTRWPALISAGYAPPYHNELIEGFQQIHDCFEPHLWLEKIQAMLKEHGLEFNRHISPAEVV